MAALLGARQALTEAPEAARFTWRARCQWVNGTHSQTTIDSFAGLGAEHHHRQPYTVDADHPEIFASADNGPTPPELALGALASCLMAGLAMSWHLSARGIDHMVLERGAVAQAWRTERWDSLRLLTPAWLCGLPGRPYAGPDPEGFLPAAATADLLMDNARRIEAPVRAGQPVVRARRTGRGFEVVTATDRVTADALVVATGAAAEAHVPPWAAALPPTVAQWTALDYRRPGQLPDGEVLVVGASASGAQIADELARAGRPVTLAVGEHVRVPRTYRGVDIHRWLHVIGLLDERWDEADDIDRARRLPSFQLIGTPERRDLGLTTLQAAGVRLVGRAMTLDRHRLLCSGGPAHQVAAADLKANRLLRRIDVHATAHGLDGLYVLGLPFLRRRRSSFISGVGPDAADLAAHLHTHLRPTGALRVSTPSS